MSAGCFLIRYSNAISEVSRRVKILSDFSRVLHYQLVNYIIFFRAAFEV